MLCVQNFCMLYVSICIYIYLHVFVVCACFVKCSSFCNQYLFIMSGHLIEFYSMFPRNTYVLSKNSVCTIA